MVPAPPLVLAENCTPAEPDTTPPMVSVFEPVAPSMVVTPELLVMLALIVAVPPLDTNPERPEVPVVEMVMGAEEVPPVMDPVVSAAAAMGDKLKVTLFAKVMPPARTRVELPLVVMV